MRYTPISLIFYVYFRIKPFQRSRMNEQWKLDKKWRPLFFFIAFKNFLFKNLNLFKFIMIEFVQKSGCQSFWINTCNNSFTKISTKIIIFIIRVKCYAKYGEVYSKLQDLQFFFLAGIQKWITKMLKHFNWLSVNWRFHSKMCSMFSVI